MIRAQIDATFDSFRREARRLVAQNAEPADVVWEVTTGGGGQAVLFGGGDAVADAPHAADARSTFRVPRAFVEAAEIAAYHRDPRRWSLFYRLLVRLARGAHGLMDDAADADVIALRALTLDVKRDEHKMHAFVRFRRVEATNDAGDVVERFVAWHRPDNPILKLAAPFFQRRFPAMCWTILTPDASATWDMHALTFGPGAPRDAAPSEDALEEMFRTYYKATYNPARLNLKTQLREMPRRHWATLPETSAVPEMVAASFERVATMTAPEPTAAASWVPVARDLNVLRDAAQACEACPIHKGATQAVFGEGPRDARLMLVGEQPGDQEDTAGRPFVGPAGEVLMAAMERVGLRRQDVYLTNAVKHFKFEPRGKRRLHSKPTYEEIRACRGWLDAELEVVKPKMILCLGASAAQSFLGKQFRVGRSRGQVFETPWAPWFMATYHPSALLRMPDEAARAEATRYFDEDIAAAARALAALAA